MTGGRPSRKQMFMSMAYLVASRSTCNRAQVGVIITDLEGTSVVSMGYNGNAAGLPDTCDTTTPGACGCLHAESNALIKAPYQGQFLTMYTTLSPCLMCAKLIINSHVRNIITAEMYRDKTGWELLHEAWNGQSSGLWFAPELNPKLVAQPVYMKHNNQTLPHRVGCMCPVCGNQDLRF